MAVGYIVRVHTSHSRRVGLIAFSEDLVLIEVAEPKSTRVIMMLLIYEALLHMVDSDSATLILLPIIGDKLRQVGVTVCLFSVGSQSDIPGVRCATKAPFLINIALNEVSLRSSTPVHFG